MSRRDFGCLGLITEGFDWIWGVFALVAAVMVLLRSDGPFVTGEWVPLLVIAVVVPTPFLSLAAFKSDWPAWAVLLVLVLNLAVGAGLVAAIFAGAIPAMPMVVPVALNVILLGLILIDGARRGNEEG
jgi:hypothetical protein